VKLTAPHDIVTVGICISEIGVERFLNESAQIEETGFLGVAYQITEDPVCIREYRATSSSVLAYEPTKWREIVALAICD
jgi:hypothetical protein